MGDGVVKPRALICILLSLALLNTASAAGKSGENIDPVVEETIFSEITYTETSTDLEDWEITLTLNDDAFNNNTTFTVLTQICVNDGYCLAPEEVTLTTTDDKTFTGIRTTVEDHTYVNWKVKATYNDDNSTESFPSKGYYKVWSDCWFDDDKWGGELCEESEDDESFLPALGVMMTAGAIALAAVRRSE